MDDHHKITEVLVRYATGIDSRDWKLFRTCFTDDAHFDYGYLGTFENPDKLTEYMRRSHSGPSMHRLSNFATVVDNDHATARTYVDAAVKRFQARHGLPEDGVMGAHTYAAMNVSASVRLGQLETNLVRLRSMSGFLGDRYVMVNIPAAQIEAVENGRVVSRHTAIVGKIDRQTPILNSQINEVIVNPYWNAPESIVRKDIIPLMRKNPNYLKDNFIRILGPGGVEVDPMTIDWNTEEAAKLHFRQDPGKINAMASVKINFPNPHAVYMHDTPQQSLFNNLMRFDSSGCVRVQNVRDLVTWLLRHTAGWDRQRLERTIRNEEDVPVQLAVPVPIYLTYVSAWSTGDGVAHFRDDIYAMDGAEQLQITSGL